MVIQCTQVDTIFQPTQNHPHNVILLKLSRALFVMGIMLKAEAVVILVAVSNGLTEICQATHHDMVMLYDFSDNQIFQLSGFCFSQKQHLKFIKLKKNSIQTITMQSFQNMPKLVSLDLSYNALISVSLSSLQDFNSLAVLNILENPLEFHELRTFPVQNFFPTIILTEQYKICCLSPKEVKCPSQPPWYKSCSNLLSSKMTQVFFYVYSVPIVVLNIASFLLHMSSLSSKAKVVKTSRNITAILNCVDFSFAFPLIVLLSVDISFGRNFVLSDLKWTSSATCLIVFGKKMLFAFLSPCILIIFSLMRTMIVLHPLDTQFKTAIFVTKLVSIVSFLVLVLVSVFAILVKMISWNIPFDLCSPFVDPMNEVIVIFVLTVLTAVVQILSTVFICGIHLLMMKELKVNQKQLKQVVSKQRSYRMTYFQTTILCVSNIFCWIPSCLIYLIILCQQLRLRSVVVLTSVCLESVNSIVNPTVFIVSMCKKLVTLK